MATLTTTPIKVFVSGETVTPTKLNELSQSTVALTAGTIVAADIASDAVTTAKILDANVTTAKLADSAVTTAKINNAAITAAKLNGAQTGSAPIYGCRAWVNFNGARNATDTGASTNGANVFVRASGNVASVLKNEVGNYTVTFATAMPDANYAIVNGSSQSVASLYFGHLSFASQSAGSFSVLFSRQDNGTLRADDELCMISIFR